MTTPGACSPRSSWARPTDGQGSASLHGVQHKARLVRALYERLDDLAGARPIEPV
ncbi:hypothetical protein ACIG3E_23455 [Streptomyces sp. NPDC053474]|uniref:hypothetical protein n=1 Tax=Streptomyces sp. NPDC053474 TaxID=3365704 RepID=UPI0037CE886E